MVEVYASHRLFGFLPARNVAELRSVHSREEWQLDGGRETIDSNNAVELYDIGADIGERRNLATTRKAKRDELLGDLLAWLKTTGAPLPTRPAAGGSMPVW